MTSSPEIAAYSFVAGHGAYWIRGKDSDIPLDFKFSAKHMAAEICEQLPRAVAQNRKLRGDAVVAEEHRKAMLALAEAEAERKKEMKAKCHSAFEQNANKKVSDLTVAESALLDACKSLGYY